MDKKPRVRPYLVTFEGEERLIEAPSKQAMQRHLLKPILDKICPQPEDITQPSPVQIGHLMRKGVAYEVYGEEAEDADDEQSDLGITAIRNADDIREE